MASPEPFFQDGLARRHDVDKDALGIFFLHLHSSLNVDFQHDVVALAEHLVYVFLRRAVIMVVYLGVFQERVFLQQLFKTAVVGKIIVDAVFFARTRLARRHGNRIVDIGKMLPQCVAYRPLAGAGRAGDDDKQT